MTDPAELDPLDRAAAARDLPWLGAARAALWVAGAGYALLSLGMPPLLYAAFALDPQFEGDPVAPWFGAGLGGFGLLCCGAFAAANFAVAAGLARGARWAWIGGLVLGGLYLPSACFPFGGALFYALLQPGARALFLEGRLPEGAPPTGSPLA
jgi:hypothetical protein